MKHLTRQSIGRTAAVTIALVLWLTVSPITAFFWTIFLVWAAFKLDSRIIGYGAVALLVLIPIVLTIDSYQWMAEQLAVYVFYLLCITVALQIIELVRDGGKESKEGETQLENTSPHP